MRKAGVVMMALVAAVALWRAEERGVETVRPEALLETSLATRAPAMAGGGPEKVTTKAVVPNANVFPRRVDLSRFHEIAAKVFTTETENEARDRLIHDVSLLADSARLLVKPPADAALGDEDKDRALELLLAAVRAKEPAAGAALGAVVRDATIEDAKVDRTVRLHLAGLKAEAMFEWSAASPEAAEDMTSLLPGPVSRKIWANVLERQNANLAESLAGRVAAGEDQ